MEMADVVYTGSDVLSSALTMHKAHCKTVVNGSGIPVLPWHVLRRDEAQHNWQGTKNKITLDFPLFVKPCNLGSSVGISAAHNETELDAALAKTFKYDTEAIVEPYVEDMLEVNAAVIEGNPNAVSVTEITIPSDKILTYEDKYMRGSKNKTGLDVAEGMAGLVRDIDSKKLSTKIKEMAQQYSLQAFEILGCAGTVRFDFILDCKAERLYFNEPNPIPGSFAFYLWEKTEPRWLYTDIIDNIIEGAEIRYSKRSGVCKDMGFKALCR